MKFRNYVILVFLVTVFILFIISIVRFAYTADLFKLKTVNVSGNSIISSETIVELSGLETGVSVFKIDLNLVNSRIQKELVLKNISVERILPNTVLISVEERMVKGNLYAGKLYQLREDNLVTEDQIHITRLRGVFHYHIGREVFAVVRDIDRLFQQARGKILVRNARVDVI